MRAPRGLLYPRVAKQVPEGSGIHQPASYRDNLSPEGGRQSNAATIANVRVRVLDGRVGMKPTRH